MMLGGLQKQTLLDFPGKIACTVFTTGCNFRCPFCYNPEIVVNPKSSALSEKEFFSFLAARKGFLDGVCICGGEPTIHSDLTNFIKKIKKLSYLIKLDTNGSNPKLLSKLIESKLINYVAMDIKAPKEKYENIVGAKVNIKKVEQSIAILKNSNIDYEFRTTIVPNLLCKKDILAIAKWISPAKKYYLQNFQPKKTIDSSFESIKPYPIEKLEDIKNIIKHHFEICEIR